MSSVLGRRRFLAVAGLLLAAPASPALASHRDAWHGIPLADPDDWGPLERRYGEAVGVVPWTHRRMVVSAEIAPNHEGREDRGRLFLPYDRDQAGDMGFRRILWHNAGHAVASYDPHLGIRRREDRQAGPLFEAFVERFWDGSKPVDGPLPEGLDYPTEKGIYYSKWDDFAGSYEWTAVGWDSPRARWMRRRVFPEDWRSWDER